MRRTWLFVVGSLVLSCGMAYGRCGEDDGEGTARNSPRRCRPDHKGDEEVANRLKEIKLSEPLTPEVMNTFVGLRNRDR